MINFKFINTALTSNVITNEEFRILYYIANLLGMTKQDSIKLSYKAIIDTFRIVPNHALDIISNLEEKGFLIVDRDKDPNYDIVQLNLGNIQMTYQEQLLTDQWKNKRKEIIEKRGGKCEKCGYDVKRNLQVHHKYYKPNLKAWEYPDEDLVCLCKKCHQEAHNIDNYKNKEIDWNTYNVWLENYNDWLNNNRTIDDVLKDIDYVLNDILNLDGTPVKYINAMKNLYQHYLKMKSKNLK